MPTAEEFAVLQQALAEATRDLGGELMVLGSPKQRNLLPGVTYDQALDYATEVFTRMVLVLQGYAGEITDVIRVKQGYAILKVEDHQMAGVPALKDALPRIQDALYYQKLQPALRAYLTKLREDAFVITMPGYVDSGASPNQTRPVETTAAKEADAKKLNKKHKKLGIL